MRPSSEALSYLSAFLGGVGVSFTACVLPLVPVIIGFLGIRTGTSRLRGFILTLSFVTGAAVTYSALGLAAALTGRVFGLISSGPLVHIFSGLVIIFFGLAYLDLFEINLGRLIRPPDLKQRNILSVFLLGLASGLVIGPCTAPALGAIFAYLAAKKNIFYGATLLLSFAYGMGLIIILGGTFSSVLLNLPKSGRWMVYLKRILSVVFFGMGLYFIYTGIRRF